MPPKGLRFESITGRDVGVGLDPSVVARQCRVVLEAPEHEQRVRLEDASEAHVTLGWELERRRGVWLTSRWYWHDFRPEFHPGIGEEEWTRICG